MLETVAGGFAKKCPILLSSADYPVRISWNCAPDSVVSSLRFGDREIPVRGSGDVTISGPQRQIVLTISRRTAVPAPYALMQNYPNPFNLSTTIRYDIPEDCRVILTVYDLLGREGRTLAAGGREAGTYVIPFDATNLPSGVYFYRIEAGRFREARKMMLLR